MKKHKKNIEENKKVYRLTSRLYKDLKNDQQISLKKMKGICGLYDYDDDSIVLDFRREIIPTLIHELLHKWHPWASETKILEMERAIVNKLTAEQAKRILKYLVNAI